MCSPLGSRCSLSRGSRIISFAVVGRAGCSKVFLVDEGRDLWLPWFSVAIPGRITELRASCYDDSTAVNPNLDLTRFHALARAPESAVHHPFLWSVRSWSLDEVPLLQGVFRTLNEKKSPPIVPFWFHGNSKCSLPSYPGLASKLRQPPSPSLSGEREETHALRVGTKQILNRTRSQTCLARSTAKIRRDGSSCFRRDSARFYGSSVASMVRPCFSMESCGLDPSDL